MYLYTEYNHFRFGKQLKAVKRLTFSNEGFMMLAVVKAMTKRVPVLQKAKRIGDGERPMRVAGWGKSLLSC